MPSSLIFTGLVVLWLLILVPAVARHQQEVARPSGASLAARVLARPRQRGGRRGTEEENRVDGDDLTAVATRTRTIVPAGGSTRRHPSSAEPPRWVDEPEPEAPPRGRDEHDGSAAGRDPIPLRYRPGRGGFDPAADAKSARRRYAFRQRAVLALLLAAVATAVAAAIWKPALWWAHGGVDVVLAAYLVYLRRQVRLEMAIRRRRAARLTGNRRASGDLSVLDEWARRSQEAAAPPPVVRAGSTAAPATVPGADEVRDRDDEDDVVDADGPDAMAEDGDATRIRGVGEPIGLLPARRRGVDAGSAEPDPALPLLQPAPPPALPPGAELLLIDDDELDLQDLRPAHPDGRCGVS